MQVTGADCLDAPVALAVAVVILITGLRLVTRSSRMLVDEGLPPDEVEAIAETVRGFGPSGVAGFHKLRARRAGHRRHADMHVQFREGTSLEGAHRTAHELQDAIAARAPNVDVLIHLEPEDRVEPGTEIPAEPPPSAAEARSLSKQSALPGDGRGRCAGSPPDPVELLAYFLRDRARPGLVHARSGRTAGSSTRS